MPTPNLPPTYPPPSQPSCDSGSRPASRRWAAPFFATIRGPLAAVFAMLLPTHDIVGAAEIAESPTRSEALTFTAGPKSGFTLMDPGAVGVRFTNELRGDLALTNAVAHNGAGLAIGDVNGDRWPDLFFCNLQGPNRLYLNRKNWRFEEVDPGPASCGEDLSTAAVLSDLDGDGDLDLLVNGIAAGTRLFLNDGHGVWTESTSSGLSRSASAMSMALADIDGDGDLDLYCTHYIDVMHLADPTTRFALARRGEQWEVARVNGESTRAPKWKDRFEATGDGKVRELPEVHGFYRNDGGGSFTALQDVPGTYVDERGQPLAPYRDWGLSVMFRDLNGDGAPDLYVCNDNASPDRVWINTGKGTFRPLESGVLRHTSRSSMGLDFADIDRDGRDDLLVLDMLASDHAKRMTQLVREHPDRSQRERPTEVPRFGRNTLFRARADGTFAETALHAGLAATGWSWCPIFLDVDLDGFEDLLVTTGFAFDVMDQDSNDQVRQARLPADQLKRFRRMHPGWPTPRLAFRNQHDGTFAPMSSDWGFDQAGIAYGMAVGDLDRDGDLDVVVSNLNEPAGLYRNEAGAARIAVRLAGAGPNTQGIGARLSLASKSITQSQDMIAGGRYLSSDEAVRVFAAGDSLEGPFTLTIRWPGGSETSLPVESNHAYDVVAPGASRDSGSRPKPLPGRTNEAPFFADATRALGHRHLTGVLDETLLQPLLPRRLGSLGPSVSWWDANGDGWEDLMVSGGRSGVLAVFTNHLGISFALMATSAPSASDQTSVLGWTSGNGQRRWLVALSNYGLNRGEPSEIQAFDPAAWSTPRRWSAGLAATGPMATADMDGDGDLDLFVGGRSMPGRFPEPAPSMVWLNDGEILKPSESWSRALAAVGLVTGVALADLDADGKCDLVIATEWGPLKVFRNLGHGWEDVTARWGFAESTGLWQCVAVGDFDEDGRPDLAAGNWGRNSAYDLVGTTPCRLYFGDWDDDGRVEVVEAWRDGDHWLPWLDRKHLSAGMPDLQQRFPTHQAYAATTVDDLLGTRRASVKWLEVVQRESAVLLNRGDRWERVPLPQAAQLSPAMDMAVGDLDGDGHEDLFLAQNFFGGATELTRDDAGQGLWLRGDGKGGFSPVDSVTSGIRLDGEQRGVALADVNQDRRLDLAVGQVGGPTKLFVNQRARPGLRVILKGPPVNPEGVGAQLRVVYADARRGPVRLVSAGSGSGCQGGSTQVLGLNGTSTGVEVRWPDGRMETQALSENQLETTIARK